MARYTLFRFTQSQIDPHMGGVWLDTILLIVLVVLLSPFRSPSILQHPARCLPDFIRYPIAVDPDVDFWVDDPFDDDGRLAPVDHSPERLHPKNDRHAFLDDAPDLIVYGKRILLVVPDEVLGGPLV